MMRAYGLHGLDLTTTNFGFVALTDAPQARLIIQNITEIQYKYSMNTSQHKIQLQEILVGSHNMLGYNLREMNIFLYLFCSLNNILSEMCVLQTVLNGTSSQAYPTCYL